MLESLVADEAVMGLSQFSMSGPFLTVRVIAALPAKLNSSLLHCTSDEGTTDFHSVFSLAPTTPALAFSLVIGAEPTRKAANTDLGVLDLHLFQAQRSV